MKNDQLKPKLSPKLYSIKQAAELLNVSSSVLYLWSHLQGKAVEDRDRDVPDIRFTRVGSRLFIAAEEVDSFIARHTGMSLV